MLKVDATERMFSDPFERHFVWAFQTLVANRSFELKLIDGLQSEPLETAVRLWFASFIDSIDRRNMKKASEAELDLLAPVLEKYTDDYAKMNELASLMIKVVDEFRNPQERVDARQIRWHGLVEEALRWTDNGTRRPRRLNVCLNQLIATGHFVGPRRSEPEREPELEVEEEMGEEGEKSSSSSSQS